MKKIKTNIRIAVIVILYLVLFYFSLEYLESNFFPKINKNLWSFIFIVLVPLILVFIKYKSITKKTKIYKLQSIIKLHYNESGFDFKLNNQNIEVFWAEISSIRIFGKGSNPENEMIIELDIGKNRAIQITENSEFWPDLKIKLYTQFPIINTEWESKIMQPPFNKGEIEIFHRE